jgi:hypothetical protein
LRFFGRASFLFANHSLAHSYPHIITGGIPPGFF